MNQVLVRITLFIGTIGAVLGYAALALPGLSDISEKVESHPHGIELLSLDSNSHKPKKMENLLVRISFCCLSVFGLLICLLLVFQLITAVG